MVVRIFSRPTYSSGNASFTIPPASRNITITVAAPSGGNGGGDGVITGGTGGAGRVGVFTMPDNTAGTFLMGFGERGGDGTNTGIRGAYGQQTGSQSLGSGGWGGNDRPEGTSGGGGGGGAAAYITFLPYGQEFGYNLLAIAGGGGGGGGASSGNAPIGDEVDKNNGEDGLSFVTGPTTFTYSNTLQGGGDGVGGGYAGPTFTTSEGTLNYVDSGNGGGAGGGAGGAPGGYGRDADGNRITDFVFVGGEQGTWSLGGEYAGYDWDGTGAKPNVASGGPAGGSVYIPEHGVTLVSESLNYGDGYISIEYTEVDPRITSFTSTPALSNNGIPATEVTLQWSVSEEIGYTYQIIRGGTAVPVLDQIDTLQINQNVETYYEILPGVQKIVFAATSGGGGGSAGYYDSIGGVGGSGGGGGASCVVETDDIQVNENTIYIYRGSAGQGGNIFGSPNGTNGGDVTVRYNGPTGASILNATGGGGGVINFAQKIAFGGEGGIFSVGSRGKFLSGGYGGRGGNGLALPVDFGSSTDRYYGGGGAGAGGFGTSQNAVGGRGRSATQSASFIHQGQGPGAGGGGGPGGFLSGPGIIGQFWRNAAGGGGAGYNAVGTSFGSLPYPLDPNIPETGAAGIYTAQEGGYGGSLSTIEQRYVGVFGQDGLTPGGGGGGSSRQTLTSSYSGGGRGGSSSCKLWAFRYSDVSVDGGVLVNSGDETVNTYTMPLGVTSEADVNSPLSLPVHLILDIGGQYKVLKTINITVKNDNTPSSVTVGGTAFSSVSGTLNKAIDNLEPQTTYYTIVNFTGVDMPTFASTGAGSKVSLDGINFTSNVLVPVSQDFFFVQYTSSPFNTSTTPGGTNSSGEIIGQTNPQTISFSFGTYEGSFVVTTRAPVIQETFDSESLPPSPNAFPSPDIDTIFPNVDEPFVTTTIQSMNDIEIPVEIRTGDPDSQVSINGSEYQDMRGI